MEFANLYEKDLAQSRRAEKEFFIFPNKPKKQDKYVHKWKGSMDILARYLEELEGLLTTEKHNDLVKKITQAKNIISENRALWEIVVKKFQNTKSYDTVNNAEYGTFKKRIHVLEDIGKELSAYAFSEVEKGRKEIDKIQHQTNLLIKIITFLAVFWGILIPIFFARQMTSTIIYLSRIADDISRGKIDQQIKVTRKDELGDLALAIKRLQTSTRIMLRKFDK